MTLVQHRTKLWAQIKMQTPFKVPLKINECTCTGLILNSIPSISMLHTKNLGFWARYTAKTTVDREIFIVKIFHQQSFPMKIKYAKYFVCIS